MTEQLVLQLPLRRRWTPERFVGEALQNLRASAEVLHWIDGPESAGKSHLLVALCQQAERENRSSMYIDLGATQGAEALTAIDHVEVIALDNVDRVLEDPHWALALYGLINSLQQRGQKVRAYWAAKKTCVRSEVCNRRSRIALSGDAASFIECAGRRSKGQSVAPHRRR